MVTKSVLFVDGVPDNHVVKISNVQEDGNFSIITTGSSNIFSQIDDTPFDKSFLLLDANQEQKINIGNIDTIFNQISDADTHKITLAKMKNILNQLKSKVKFLNLPQNIENTTRENIYLLLQRIDKVYVPKTIKITPKTSDDIYKKIQSENFKLPVIFRQAGDHGGISTIIINNQNEPKDFYPFALDGREYYLTQYIDYKQEGIYKKLRLIVIGGEVFIRHVLFDNHWLIHSTNSREFMRQNKIYIEKEKKILDSFDNDLKPYIKKQITEICQKIGLDYFGIDCFVDKNFNMLIFEVNASMNILIKPKGLPNEFTLNKKTDLIIEAIKQMIGKRI